MSVPDLGATYRQMLLGGRFCYGAEVVTTRGLAPYAESDKTVQLARDLLKDPRIGWISVTDNPGGTPMLPPDWLAGFLVENCARIVLHLTCKDMNRNGLEASAWRYASEGFDNVLAITGDYPTTGFGGTAAPVFDLDSVGLIALLRSMNDGLQTPNRLGRLEALPRTNFFIGCCVSPFKRHERELMPQYFKLLRKIAMGAEWVIPQLGYDMRKFHEVKLLLESRGQQVPIVGNVYVLTRFVAKLFNSGKLAGCVVSDALLNKVEKYAAGEDKGRAFFQEFAAKQLAVFKGLGFAAGYLGGLANADAFGKIIDLAESFGGDDWKEFLKEIQYAQPDEFFLFSQVKHTGMAEPGRLNPDYLESLKTPPKTRQVTLGYRISRKFHDWVFSRDRGLFGTMARFYGWLERKPDGLANRMAHAMEKQAKFIGFGCQDCGDCSLPDCGYLCPMAACSKHSRNGPCGGSSNGRCELDDKECFWARVYERLKYYGESEGMFSGPAVLYNAELKDTSSWANTFLNRDHHAARDENETTSSG